MNLNKSAKERVINFFIIKARLDKHNEDKQHSRNDLVRQFSLDRVNKWVNHLQHDDISHMNSNDISENLNSIRTVAVQVQSFVIHII